MLIRLYYGWSHMKKVLVTGILGQDGANMAEYLLFKNEEPIQVYGMMRRSSIPNFTNIEKFKDHQDFQLVFGDLGDEISIDNLIKRIQPDYFINFAANSFVGVSWDMPLQVMDTNAIGVLRCLESIRKFKPDCRFYSAGSSEEWGDVDYSPQDIKHPIKPRSPYGASKAAARHLVKVYRESYDMFAVHGILFNHEGTKRGEEFVTRKITKGVARIKKCIDTRMSIEIIDPIELGNLEAKRDWSDSEDFVEGVWLMVNQESPKDYILSSGETHTIREFVSKAFRYAGISGSWTDVEGDPLRTKFILNSSRYEPLVVINEEFYRPAEVDLLLGDSTPIREELGWSPKVSFDKLVEKMVNFDVELQERQSSK
jgi:GDPmannose 4,6-dehydratase